MLDFALKMEPAKLAAIILGAIFALIITGMFGFVGCGNKEETPATTDETTNTETSTGLTESEVVGNYEATQVVLTVEALGLDNQTITKADYEALVAKTDKTAAEIALVTNYLPKFFNLYHLTAQKTILMNDDTDVMATWKIENNQIVCEQGETESDDIVIGETTYANGTINISLSMEAPEPSYSFVAVLTIVKQA